MIYAIIGQGDDSLSDLFLCVYDSNIGNRRVSAS